MIPNFAITVVVKMEVKYFRPRFGNNDKQAEAETFGNRRQNDISLDWDLHQSRRHSYAHHAINHVAVILPQGGVTLSTI